MLWPVELERRLDRAEVVGSNPTEGTMSTRSLADKAPVYETGDRRFESVRVYHLIRSLLLHRVV